MTHQQITGAGVKVIDLDEFTPPGATVLATRPWGIVARSRSNVDMLAKDYDRILIRVPKHVSRVNPSFLEEFLEDVFTTYGWEEFTRKFSFVFPHHMRLNADLAEAATRVLQDSNIHSSSSYVKVFKEEANEAITCDVL